MLLVITFAAFTSVVAIVSGMDQLHVAFEWNQLDYKFPSQEARELALEGGDYVPGNNLAMGLEVFRDRMFITVPRWKRGVPASLNYIFLNDTSTKSPKLTPYPNWAAHRRSDGAGEVPELVSPFRARADKCSRLWVLDSGKSNILESDAEDVTPPSLVIYDLNTDELLRKFAIPKDQVTSDSFFANIAIEDATCEDTYAYAADLGKPGLVVYSWAQNESWRIKHHYFHPDPLSGEFNVMGIKFEWTDGLFGLGLSASDSDNFSTLYFHPMVSTNEFSVSTKYLRNASIAEASFKEFKHLGSRGPNAQSSVSFVDKKTGVLFYALVNLNAVACWKTSNKAYTIKSQGRIYMSNVTMVFPGDIKVDDKDNLWVLSNRLPKFMYQELDLNDTNFRVLTAPVIEAISHTACDITPRVDILHKFGNAIKNITTATFGSSTSNVNLPTISVLAVCVFVKFMLY